MLRATLIFLTVSVFLGQSAPERKVAGSAVSSRHDPHVQIHLPESAKYVGADRWNQCRPPLVREPSVNVHEIVGA